MRTTKLFLRIGLMALVIGGNSLQANNPEISGLNADQASSILTLLSSFGADQTIRENVKHVFNGETVGEVTQSGLSKAMVDSILSLLSTFGAYQELINNIKNVLIPAPTPAPPTIPDPPETERGWVTVSSTVQLANSLAPENAARLPFTRFILTAKSIDTTIDNITIQRFGAIDSTLFNSIILLDQDGLQIGDSSALDEGGKTKLGTSFTVPANTSRVYTIAVNMQSDLDAYAGQVGGIAVIGINTSATVAGTLPITGSQHTVNATLSLGAFNSPANGTLVSSADDSLDVGTVNKVFTSVKWSAAGEDMYLKSIRWEQTGSASNVEDLANVVTLVDGVVYPTVINGDYFTTVFPGNGILTLRGRNKEVSVRGDVVNGSTRTIRFDIQKQSDVHVVGKTFGYGALPAFGTDTDNDNDAAFRATDDPYFDAYSHTVSAGTMTVSAWNSGVPAQNVGYNLQGENLGGFTIDVRGEPITIGTMKFGVGITTGSSEIADITSITIVDENGVVLASATDGTDTDQYQLISFSDSVTFSPGITNLRLIAKYGTDFSNNDVVQASTTPSGWTTVKGDDTGVSITPSPSTAVSGSSMTVKTGALEISQSTQPTARTVIAGADQFEFARYVFDATSSGEDVRVSTFLAKYSFATVASTDLTGCQLWNGSTSVTADTVLHPSVSTGEDENFTFDGGGLVIPKGTSKTLSLKCNVSSGATSGSFTWGNDDNASAFTSASGLVSSQTITETWTTATGQAMTASSGGSFTVTSDTQILYKMSEAGATDVTLGAFRFKAGLEEDITIEQIALQLGNTASSAPSDLMGEKVTLWHDGVQIGTAGFTGGNSDFATSSSISVLVKTGKTETITVKASLAGQDGNSKVDSFGALISIVFDGDNTGTNGDGTYATGVSSGTKIASGTTADVATNGLRIFKAVPSIELVSSTGPLAPSEDLYAFEVHNTSDDDIVFQKFTFTIATTGGAMTGWLLKGNGVEFNTSVSAITGTTLEITGTGTSLAQIIPAGGKKKFVLSVTNIVDTASVAESVSITLVADTVYPDELTTTSATGHMGTVTTVEAGTEATANNLIWTPFSTTTPEATAAVENNLDWTNGYGMPGFPSNGNFSTQSFTRSSS
ncbi:hypothetical protein COB55_02815 [Candidatus Wolfebacteria bacterium]|nr:MAG: hypothetical protein COB55_02815 [Candidatus Wolfebacteria bacterium]